MLLTNHATTQFHLLQAIHHLVHIKHDMGAVRDEYSSVRLQSVFLQRFQLLEETGYVNNAATSDDIDAAGIHETAREDMEVVRDAVRDNGVSGVVTTLGAGADLRLMGQDIGQFSFSFISPLCSEHHSSRHREGGRQEGKSGGAAGGFSIPR